MGSSGGGSTPRVYSAEELEREIQKTGDTSDSAQFDARVSDCLRDLLKDFNARDVNGTRRILERVQSDLGREITQAVDMAFGGSVAKHTYVDGLSDVDALVLLNNSGLENRKPSEAKTLLADCLRKRYGADAVEEGRLAVTLRRGDTVLQLLPALRYGPSFRIASLDGSQWMRTQPAKFARALTTANERMNGRLVPSIKLIKAIVGRLPEQQRITGYHVESMAINVFRDYTGPMTTKTMVGHFFRQAAGAVRSPIRDRSGQSTYVDEYLGPEGSAQRRNCERALDRVSRRIAHADEARSPEMWRDLFE